MEKIKEVSNANIPGCDCDYCYFREECGKKCNLPNGYHYERVYNKWMRRNPIEGGSDREPVAPERVEEMWWRFACQTKPLRSSNGSKTVHGTSKTWLWATSSRLFFCPFPSGHPDTPVYIKAASRHRKAVEGRRSHKPQAVTLSSDQTTMAIEKKGRGVGILMAGGGGGWCRGWVVSRGCCRHRHEAHPWHHPSPPNDSKKDSKLYD